VNNTISLKKILRYIMAFVAGICLIVIVVSTYKFLKLSSDKLYKDAFVSYRLPFTGITHTTESERIENYYHLKNYKAIIAEAKKPRLPDDKIFLLIGVSYLHTNDPFNAIATFRQINPSGDYYQDGQYFLSLAYLKNNDYDQALGLMQQIKNNEKHIYHKHFSSSFLNNIRMLKWK